MKRSLASAGANAPDAANGPQAEVLRLGQRVDGLQEVPLAEARELRLELSVVPVLPLVGSASRAAGIERDPRPRLDLSPVWPATPTRCGCGKCYKLLTNADRHTPADGSILVRGFAEAGDVGVEVRNTGSHLTDEQIGRVFDRFHRTDPARERATGGSGLGLAIVKNLVEAHGGRVWAWSDAAGVVVGFAVPAPAAA